MLLVAAVLNSGAAYLLCVSDLHISSHIQQPAQLGEFCVACQVPRAHCSL